MIVCTLGDLVLDVIVRLDRPLVAGDDVPARTRLTAGGQAANVAAWAAALGARARYIGRRGDDEPATLVERELRERGVALHGPRGGRTGVIVSLVGDDRDRSMASDRGAGASLSPDDLEPTWFRGAHWLHVSGYALSRPDGAAAAEHAAGLARAAGARVSLDAASSTLIEATPDFAARAAAVAPDLLFATAPELAAFGPAPEGASTVVKRGRDGCTVVDPDGRRSEHPAVPARPVDATGAGDAFAAGFLVGGPSLALEAGARCVTAVGAMPA